MNVPQTLMNAVDELRTQLAGTLILPEDAQYDEARAAWNLCVDQHPALIVIAHNADDVAAAVRHARREALPIAVQATGHGVVRAADGALLIITAQMQDVSVDANARTAWVSAGVQWGAVLEKTQAVGLAPLLGSAPHVGAVGYTLGGGLGWLARKYGMACDSVRFFEVVTAEGERVRASETENSDLFWALRGGGGAFGIVTGMEIDLYPVSMVYAGNLVYPVEMAREVMLRYRDWIATLPEETTTSIVLMNFPPIPAVPEGLRGRSAVIVRGCHCGSTAEGEALLEYWRDWRAPMVDAWQAIPFRAVASISQDPLQPSPSVNSGAWLHELTDEAIDTLIQYGTPQGGAPCPLVVTEVRYAGGAISRVSPEASAYGHRDATLILSLIAIVPAPQLKAGIQAHMTEMKATLGPAMTGGVSMNFLSGKEACARVQDAYSSETYARLRAVKQQYDPENLFAFGWNSFSTTTPA